MNMITVDESDIKLFGKFVETSPLHEQLAIVICPYAIPFSQRWGNNGLSADFIGEYASRIFNDSPLTIGNNMLIKDVQNSVAFIANELLENAMKYSHYSYKYPIKLRLNIDGSTIRLLITNTVTQIAAQKLQDYIHQLESMDTMEMYIHQLEYGEIEEKNSSKLGILTIINDYSGQLGWKFCKLFSEVSPIVEITTMVELKFL